MFEAALPLLFAVAAGFVFGAARLFAEPERSVSTLNRFCLYLAFPALIFANVATAELSLTEAPGFVFVIVAPTLLLVLLLGGVSARVEPNARAALGLGGSLGNIAYLGIPLSASLVGPHVVGLASLAAALHIVVTIPLGTWVLLRWGPRRGDLAGGSPLAKALRLPLVWAPILALFARSLPTERLAPLLEPLTWIGAAASPVALFMIGLYLHTHRRELLDLRRSDGALIAAKLLLLPALAFVTVLLALRLELIGADAGKVVVILAAMPTGIATFAQAEEYGIGRAAIIRGIVSTTLVFVCTFPWIAPWVLRSI